MSLDGTGTGQEFTDSFYRKTKHATGTDNETWAEHGHGTESMTQYQNKMKHIQVSWSVPDPFQFSKAYFDLMVDIDCYTTTKISKVTKLER